MNLTLEDTIYNAINNRLNYGMYFDQLFNEGTRRNLFLLVELRQQGNVSGLASLCEDDCLWKTVLLLPDELLSFEWFVLPVEKVLFLAIEILSVKCNFPMSARLIALFLALLKKAHRQE